MIISLLNGSVIVTKSCIMVVDNPTNKDIMSVEPVKAELVKKLPKHIFDYRHGYVNKLPISLIMHKLFKLSSNQYVVEQVT